MADELFREARLRFAGYEVTQDQVETVKACIDDEIAAAEAASQLTAHPEKARTPVDLQQRLCGLWTLLNGTAVGIPSAQTKIIEILRAIRALPGMEEPTGEGRECFDFDDGHVWENLTYWAGDWADSFNHYGAQYMLESCPTQEEREFRRGKWSSACAYTARLAATGDQFLTSFGACLDRATPTIQNALEKQTDGGEPQELEAASQVFYYAGSELYSRCQNGRVEGIATCTNGLWHGAEGFSVERWRFWKMRWEVMAGVEGFSTGAREAARTALEAMKTVEVD